MSRKTSCWTYGQEATVQELYRAGSSSWRLCARVYKTLCGRLDGEAEFVQDSGVTARPDGVCGKCWAVFRRDMEAMNCASEAERASLRHTTHDSE
jgi:hypothetical protein